MAALLLLLLATAVSAGQLGELARRDTGDIFTLREGVACNATQCAVHGAKLTSGDYIGACACACPPRAPLLREDKELCVDDLPECSLATFGTGASTQRIPFVYLPLKGQIIHPSREITFKNVKTPICAVSGAQFLTRKGFLDLRNTLDADVPFNLFRDEGRTFLQWSGEDDVRAHMTGRVMVVRLLCRDVASTPTSPMDLRGVFTPCVAFRVQGTPHRSNVTEVQFASNAHTAETTSASGLTVTEYVAIGISSLLLGLVYVASVFLFLHIRKRRKAASSEGDSLRKLKGLKKKDGSSITERDIVRVNNERLQNLQSSIVQDNGVVKKNPLLTMNRFHESKSFPSDSGSNLSDSEDFGDSSARSDDNLFHTKTTAALIHQHHSENQTDSTEVCHRDESGIERLPDEHVSIVETTDDREITRPVGTTRRKLYFNPAYFEPHLMADPPPAALEFLVKIREVISIAKHKMESKRYQPILNEIPEEETYSSNGNSIDVYQGLGSQRSGSVISLKRENSRKKSCLGCPGCKSDNGTDMPHSIRNNVPPCNNCSGPKGDKQHSIRKWLENIPPAKQVYNDFLPKPSQSPLANSLLSLPITDHRHKIKKQNSFTSSGAMYLTENFSKPRRQSTMSVRSEPGRRTHNYNLPLPDFENPNCPTHNYNYYAQTIGQTNDINPIGFSNYRQGSLRNNTTTPTKRRHKSDLPDMVNEAIALDHCTKSYNQSSSDEERFLNNHQNGIQHPFIRNHSESPVANDYETDSLERSTHKKGIPTPTEYPDIPSSQASPSLSNALPLEEELTMRNAVYKSSSNSNTPSPHRDISIDPSHYETIDKTLNPGTPSLASKTSASSSNDYSLVSEVYVNNNYNFGSAPTSPSGSECSMGSRKVIVPSNELDEKPGCLTIEVKDSPENYIKIHESDGFEPDTLDRKHPKHKSIIGSVEYCKEYSANLFNFNASSTRSSQRIQLRSSGTFKKPIEGMESSPKFHSLRNEYESRNTLDRPKLSPGVYSGAKSLDDSVADDIWEDVAEWESEEGRILTLELRHSKRQRQSTPPTIKQMKTLARPDVLPPLPPSDEEPIYEQPAFPPRRVESDRMSLETHSKNLNGRSLSPRTFTTNTQSEPFPSDGSLITAESSCSPMRASVQYQSSEYENLEPVPTQRLAGNSFRNFTRKRSDRGSSSGINTNTFVKGVKTESKRFRRKKSVVQDSGYLSSDSTSSRQVPRKLVIAKVVSCSESDDTENEARSESGAESVETHSVYFDNFRKPQIDLESDYSYNNNSKSSRDSVRTLTHSDEHL